ncbi:MAG: hypothetical protein ICV87_12645, partial [Gemmatimonadetes bacterium]|nr:hypothetical protein [Gemmatimonadota bacterium]
VRSEVFVGSEAEQYLRVLQVAGDAPWYPWSVRGFGPGEIDRMAPADSAHPWRAHYGLERDTLRGTRFRWVRPDARVILNSGFPFGGNDGPVWAGRGATVAVQGGFSVRTGPLSLTLAPVAFVAQNAGFDLADTGFDDGRLVYADPRAPRNIDLPQRFGDGAYARVDPGESTLRLELAGVAVGASTASQQWGPAADLPLLLGHNAGGYPHAFVGSSRPLNVGIGRVHGRLVWGVLDQSAYAVDSLQYTRRFMSGVVALFTPRGAPGLEVGGARFFHTPVGTGIDAGSLLKPFEGILKSGLIGADDDGSDVDNQLASVFFRWAFPRSGFETYGEYAREDHSFDANDFLQEPDHDAGYMLGLRRVWRRAPGELLSLRAELLNTQVSHLNAVREQTFFYSHGGARQGHTLRGQVLGAPSGYGGGGALVAVDRYTPAGRWTARYTRARGGPLGLEFRERAPDVTHALGVERLWFRGRVEVAAGLAGAFQANRNQGDNAFNANATLRFRAGL